MRTQLAVCCLLVITLAGCIPIGVKGTSRLAGAPAASQATGTPRAAIAAFPANEPR